MQQFCPLCSKRGFRRKIKALQINFNEALWTCEGEECEWPFGFEDIIYIPREVGNTWSCYWDDDKPPQRSVNECVPLSTELSLYTPPETPAEACIKDSPSDICSDSNVATNSICHNTSVNEAQLTNIVDSSNHDTQALNNIGNVSKDVLIKTDKFQSESIESKNISILEDNKKRNINLKKEKVNASTAQLKVQNKNILLNNKIDKNQDDKSSNLKEGKPTEKSIPSNLKIKTIEINVLSPLSLSYEVPASLLPTNASNNRTNTNTPQSVDIPQSNDTNLSTQSNGTHNLLTMINKQSSGQNKNAGKRYAKFHFSAIKKKIQTPNNNDSLSPNNKCLLNSNKGSSDNKGTEQIQKQDSSKAITSGPSIDNKPIKTEVIKPEPTASANGTIDSNLNIDTLLNDFIKEEALSSKINEEYILPDIDDDWINSLLH